LLATIDPFRDCRARLTGWRNAASQPATYGGNLKKQQNAGSALLALLPQSGTVQRGTALAISLSDEDEMSRNETG
jgi:hypothetical protein